LGLVIVQQVAQAHNGSVAVDSQVGRGTTFTVTLPLKSGIRTQQSANEAL
jgi:signal transduction histidine kinase